jgi:site-specific DNA-methyltransferase (adenine-specific)
MVLDPFNGAGTTTLCAEAMGRRFIGIELSEQYHTLARARHDILRQGGDPFAKIGRVPKAKNSRVKRIGNIDYQVPKKTLQLEIREIAHSLGHLPTREDVQRLSKYPIRYFDEYFISWGEVCAAARTTGMKETRGVDRRQPRTEQNTLFDLAPTHEP